MATRKQVLKKLEQVAPGANLIEEYVDGTFQVLIEAPEGHHWDHGTHCLALPLWFNGPRSEYWSMVLEDVENLAPVDCHVDACEGIRDFGFCEYWEDEQ